MASINFTQPFSIDVPDDALTTSNGEAAVVLTPATLGAIATGAAVLKSDLEMLGPVRVDLIDTANGTTYSFCPGFAGTLINASMVTDGEEIATGFAGVSVSLTNGAVTLSEALRQPIGTGAGIQKTVTAMGGPWIFTATDFFTITTVSANTAATFGGITLGVTRS